MTHDQIAWLAGLLEGEGCFSYHINSSKPHLYIRVHVEINMSDKDIIERVARLTDANTYTYPPRGMGTKTQYRAVIYGDKAIAVMKAVLPYMGKRRFEKIQKCISVWENRKANQSEHKITRGRVALRHFAAISEASIT